MMPELFIGIDYEGVPCLKITRDSADDASTTPDSEREKFAYNSKDGALAEIADIASPVVDVSDAAEWGNVRTIVYSEYTQEKIYFSPPTSNEYTYERAAVRAVAGGVESPDGLLFYSTRYFDNLVYNCPMLSDACRLRSTGRFTSVYTLDYDFFIITSGSFEYADPKQSVIANDYSADAGSLALETLPQAASVSGGIRARRYWDGASNMVVLRNIAAACRSGGRKPDVLFGPIYDQFQVVWNLPADNTPLAIAPDIPGTSGVDAIVISPTEFKVARPGYDVDTATFDELVFSAERRPAKIIAAGDVLVPAGTTYEIECGIDLPDTIVVEQATYNAGITFPFPYNLYIDDAWNFEYEISGSKVVLHNDKGINYRVRYMVLATDAEGPTTGTNDVFRQIEVNGEGVFQILRPGAAEPPTLADIIIDSRWPSIPILKEGYIDVGVGDLTHTIDFDNPRDLFPFVKFSVVRAGPGGMKIATPPIVRKRINNTGSDYSRLGGDTTYCDLLSNTQIRFSTFRGRMIEFRPGSGTVTNDAYPVIGLRYFVFGIPN
ncbi:MAG: hypothetical protein CME90_10985 [Hoeflea sp.]|nr:hypothetical protein [Hoeflea sp.]|tara:strand:+ start:32460 stop:34103 length:1644 start_codon:yes stop_codon:yes gene_type:complete